MDFISALNINTCSTFSNKIYNSQSRNWWMG